MSATASDRGATGTVTARVLNVNDDEAARYTLSRMLRRGGFSVLEAATGAEALQMVEAQPDVLVLDVKLPDLSGFEVCRRLKADPRTATIAVLLTSAALVSTEQRVHGLDGGADAYLVQPVEAIELVATVRALLRARRAEEDKAELLLREQTARRDAETANRIKDDFLATVSHELRTPLSAILGWTRMLRTGQLSDSRREHALEAIERNARAQAQIVEDILDISRIIAGSMRVEWHRVDLCQVMRNAVDAVRPAAEARGVLLDTVCEPDEAYLAGDANRLQQICWNLISNAVKFTPSGGRVEARVRRADAQLEVVVSDTGRGIDPGFLPHVFERFRQADSTPSRTQTGLGLGLAIVRHLTELHGGSVSAHSDGLGRGAVFIVSLPAGLERVDESVPEPAKPTPEERVSFSSLPLLTGVHVLVVDDETDARELHATVLGQYGAEVRVAASADEALVALDQRVPDVLVSDIAMPGTDGYALVERVRARSPERGGRVKAAALTAFARVEDAKRALSAGFDEHATKPMDPPEFIMLVARLAGRMPR